jgi:hypothetical protein
MALSDVIKKGSGIPLAGNMIEGGIAVDTVNDKVYIKNAAGNVVLIGQPPTAYDEFGTAVALAIALG